MAHARSFATYLNLITAGAMLTGGAVFVHDAEAAAVARRATKPIRRTASAPAHASAPNETQPSVGAVPASDEGPGGALAGRRNRETEPRARPRRADDPPNSGRASDTPKQGAQGAPAKATSDPGAASKASAQETARAQQAAPIPSSTTSRAADARATVAKSPAEAPSIVKSTAEKFAAEPASDGTDATRPSADPAGPGARRELSPASGVASARPAVVSLEGLVFDGGDVPRAAAALDRMKGSLARCASTETALTKNEGTIDLKFLVRAPGRAEGVDVDKARGLSGDVVKCMTSVLARSYIGAPSDDPVGVAITVRVRRPEPANN